MQFFKNLFSKTYTTSLTVTSSNGFHLRPVAQFVNRAKKYKYAITASFNGKTISAKAVNSLLTLNLDKGDIFTINAKGTSGEKVIKELKHTFELLMTDDKEVVEVFKKTHSYTGEILEGEAIFIGIALAPLYAYSNEETYIKNDVTFEEAITNSLEALSTLYNTHQMQDNADIYIAQKELLLALCENTSSLDAFTSIIDTESLALKGGKLESKISDYKDILKRVKSFLGYSYKVNFPETPFILLSEDLLPSDIQTLEKSAVQGVILQKTAPTSHTSILLRSAGIPSMIVGDNVPLITEEVILDVNAAVLVLFPSKQDRKKATESQRIEKNKQAKSHVKRFHQVFTKEGTRIHVLANVGDVTSTKLAKDEGAEGIGLLRTEFLFSKVKPSLEMQTDAYRNIFSLFSNVTVRTLDVGGDKALPYLHIPPETNPFLGIRGVRLFRTHPDIIEEQLHAIFLASQGKKIKLMFPMVSTVEEFTKAKDFAQEVAKKYTIDISNIKFGIMIEVPSVLFLIEALNEVVDFYSIGTNDLTQYLFAIERTHPLLKTDELSPVVFSVLERIMKMANKPVSICGELAANNKAIEKLIALGLDTLSVSPKSITHTKETIRHL